ncbi:hypothetical protein HPB50_012479 [Hyalomma asiaticum]|uniref:Uncharacterized protein n=1 Tax=Hyalomma asiaticum TaxID=266040 RepID=A0ACB7SEG9_HYAAI|nr:hypothetical protein HPB50_012479 [Hyalomma asiaticum]
MRCSQDRGDQLDSESVIDVGAPCSFLVPQGSRSFGSHDASSVVVSGRGRAGPASEGPFNSTMVEGGVPLHRMPTPVMSTGSRPLKTVVPEADNGTAVEPPPLPPAPPTPTGVIPPCPLGLHRQMVLREMRRHGVMFSWQLPR